ncbi:hypothetical protein BZG36_05700, partial [Bifiguratus adelaidae]
MSTNISAKETAMLFLNIFRLHGISKSIVTTLTKALETVTRNIKQATIALKKVQDDRNKNTPKEEEYEYTPVFHVSLLKPFHTSELQPDDSRPPPWFDDESQDMEYEIESIIEDEKESQDNCVTEKDMNYLYCKTHVGLDSVTG